MDDLVPAKNRHVTALPTAKSPSFYSLAGGMSTNFTAGPLLDNIRPIDSGVASPGFGARRGQYDIEIMSRTYNNTK